jgi:hypothetical protein
LGNLSGESYDNDGGDACGYIRWSDSACLFVNQAHYRWRADDGNGDVPSSEWYNASWSKRKKIGVTNNATTTLTNYPTRIDVPYDADMQTDFDDLRFTDDTGTTSISYWIENVAASATATVWVSVPYMDNLGTADIYVYYGNNSATDASDGDATFDFFDDFEDGNITEYSGNTSKFSAGTTFNYHGTYGLDAGTSYGDVTTSGIYRTGALLGQGDTIRFFQYVDGPAEDEPCAYFGVQASAQNYAVCLDQYPSDKVVLAKNVTSNDGSGTYLASTSVTFATGWYEVIIDWFTNNVIRVSVYDDAGDLFATTTASDSTYTSGGVGFGYWFQYGGWDFYSSRQYISEEPTYIFGGEQGNGGATWLAAEDDAVSGIEPGENIRVRFSVQNTGVQITGQNFRLQYASKGAALNCESVPYVNYNDVPTTSSGCGSHAACMTTSTQITNNASTAGLLSYPASLSFALGQVLEDPSNETTSMTVNANQATEIEYNFQLTSSATDGRYCFRTTDGGLDLDNYVHIAELLVQHPPTITNWSFNNAQDITLTEGATTTIMATGTVSDLNGYTDILFATSTFYRSAVTASCSDNLNSCYQIASTSCLMSDCAGTSCTLTCSAEIEHFADPTDTGIYAAQNWLAGVFVEDSTGLTDSDTSLGVELMTLFGLSVDTSVLNFGSLYVGEDTGSTNAVTSVQNTGNANIDIDLLGTDLEGTSSTIAVGETRYATSTFVYGACSICQFLTGSATQVEVDLPKPTSTSTPIEDDIYWGINIPLGTGAELHQGTNTFIATSD